MNPTSNPKSGHRRFPKTLLCGIVCGLAGWLMTDFASGQITTNAYDTAADPAYAGMGASNGLSPGGQNGGYGFGAWTFTVNNTGGAFIQTFGPSGASFDLWNTSGNSSTVAVRPFGSPLAVGQSFSVQLRLNSLDGTSNTNALILQDANGHTLFSYYHVGGDNLDGHYTDATVTGGTAANFRYDYQQFDSFTFTLNSATTYTFTDNSSGASISGFLSGAPITQVVFLRANGNPTGNGQDFQFDELTITTSGQVAPPGFQQLTPAPNALGVSTNTAISAQVIPGGAPVSAGGVTLAVDGAAVSPVIATGDGGALNVSYQPPAPLSAGATHTAQLVVTDGDDNRFTNTWHFTTVFPALPAVLPGPFAVSNNSDIVIFNAQSDGWIGANYGTDSGRTLYARFDMNFAAVGNGGGGWGGLEFYQDNTEKVLTGKNGVSPNWSVGASAPNYDLSPFTTIVPDDWHTVVVRVDFQAGGNANVSVWLNPDFNQTEAAQPNAPLMFSANDTFNNIRLRGGGGVIAQYANIVMAATSAGIGFVAPSDPQFQNYLPAVNATAAATNTPIRVEAIFGTYSISSGNVTLNVDGNDVTPAFTTTTNSLIISYQPLAPFAPGSSHYATVNLTDDNGTPYSTSWSFTVDAYPTLPVTLAGPYDVAGGVDNTLWTSQNEWIGNNYGATSSNTLYARFTLVFYDLNGETGGGGGYGGLHFFQDNSEVLIVGNAWFSTNWSLDAAGLQLDLLPVVPVVLGEPHTLVVKTVYVPNTNDNVSVWLDPDFSKSEFSQPQPPFTLSVNNSFNNVRLRCGNGTAFAEFSNITIAAKATDIGFAAAVAPGALSLQGGGTERQLSWTGDGILQTAPAITGPWTDAANQSNPQTLSTTNAATFFRLRQ